MARIKEVGAKGKLHAEFDSVPEVFRVIEKLKWVPQRDKSSNSYNGGGGDFYTFQDLASAVDVFQNHPERIRAFNENADRLESIESPGKDVEFDVTGDFLDIDRYLEGVPEMFGNAVLGNPKSVFCTINVLNSAVSFTNNSYMMHKQKRILRLVDWLETQNIRCQVVMTEDSNVSFSSIVVKQFQDPFDLNQLSVAMHPDFFRRVCFLIMEQSKTWSPGYGSALEYDKKMLKYQPRPEDGLYIYVGGYIPFKNENSGLDTAFDRIEGEVQNMIDMGMTFNENRLTVQGGSLDW
jgi:hypothetical protein